MSVRKYRYCIVPMCTNTTVTAPKIIFFDVPRNYIERKRWCLAMKRDEKKNPILSTTSIRNVCQDHFDLELDTENYIQYKLQGTKLRLKKGILPHIFTCQNKSPAPVPSASTERAAKRQRKKIVEDLLTKFELSTPDDNVIELTSNADEEFITVEDITSYFDKACQVNLKVAHRSKSTNTTSVITSDFGCTASPDMQDKACGSTLIVQECEQEFISSDAEDTDDTDCEYVCKNT